MRLTEPGAKKKVWRQEEDFDLKRGVRNTPQQKERNKSFHISLYYKKNSRGREVSRRDEKSEGGCGGGGMERFHRGPNTTKKTPPQGSGPC